MPGQGNVGNRSGHILTSFEDAFGALRVKALKMSDLAKHNLNRAISGLFKHEHDSSAKAIADEEEISQLEKDVDKDGIALLLRFHPVASDLRGVIATVKFSSSVKRIGSQAANIARRVRKLNHRPSLPEVHLIKPIRDHVVAMLRDSMDCFAHEDVKLALTLKPRDRTLDEMNAFASDELIDRMAQEPERLTGYLNLMFIARHLERIGDHATNIAEEAIYAAAAEDVRHRPI